MNTAEKKIYQKEYFKKYYPKHREELIKRARARVLASPEARKKYLKEYYARPETKEVVNSYARRTRKKDIQYRLKTGLRSHLGRAMRGGWKSGSAVRDLGCTIAELKMYLEGQFKDGMSWKNYGRLGWHMDHKIPLSFFDLTDRAQFLVACHYTNLQPLWWRDNLRKYNKI